MAAFSPNQEGSFFEPLGSSVPAATTPTANTPPKLLAQDLYWRWFQQADRDGDNRITGPDAVKFFELSLLPRDVLAKVWAHADSKRQGYLDFNAFVKAMELCSLAQDSGDVSIDTYNNNKSSGIAPPRMRGLNDGAAALGQQPSPGGGGSSNPFSAAGAASAGPGAAGGWDTAVTPTRSSTQQGVVGAAAAGPGAAYGGGAAARDLSPSPGGAPAAPSSNAGWAAAAGAPHAAPALDFGASTQVYYTSPEYAGAAGVPPGGGAAVPALFRRRQRISLSTKDCTSIAEGLKKIYFAKVRPLEEMYKFGHFFSPLMNEGDFEAKPSVLLLGQYSTGKSTFIKYLLGRDYPGIHIGPEPTTDRFVVVMHGPEERRTPGNTLVVQPDKPYQGLSQFGNGFLSKFEAALCDNRLLEEITLVDTPGVLSGEKQRVERTYDFIQVCGWFAARCDLILLLFDPYKLDISDEFKAVISTLKGHDDKVRVVLNKSDQVDQQQLMRVYGALMWSLGKVFRSPEVCRVYIGSFNASQPIREDVNPTGKALFEKEQEDLLHDLYEIPARSCDRKVNEFVKRVRAAKIHFLIMGHLRKQMPYFGQKKAQERLLDNLKEEFVHVQREYHLHPGDFPDVNRYREILSAFDIYNFPKLDKRMIKQIDDALSVDIPNLVRQMENPYL
ncbi:hypothetical protein N2152v2_004957 [Parachlorella kessleri]